MPKDNPGEKSSMAKTKTLSMLSQATVLDWFPKTKESEEDAPWLYSESLL